MRYAFGLVSLLVVIGIIALLMNMTLGKGGPVQQGKKAQDQIRPLTGRDENGMSAGDSITLALEEGGRNTAVVVRDIIVDGPMQKRFGLQTGDRIIKVPVAHMEGLFRINDLPGGTSAAKEMVLAAYQSMDKSTKLVVIRNGQEIELPQPTAAGGAPTNTNTGDASPTNSPIKLPAGIQVPGR